MFRSGKVLKVKVEISPEVVGFGRATIIEADSRRIYLQLRTSKGERRTLPKGTRLWFVSDSATNPFNGLWSTTIISSKKIAGKMTMECKLPKFEAVVQKRKHRRVAVVAPVRLEGEQFKDVQKAATRNVSRSGVGIEVHDDCTDEFQTGHHVDVVIESAMGEISFTSRVVQARYNWLANRTDIGLEFVKISDEAVATLDRLLIHLGGRPRHAPEGKESKSEAGPLSGWLKSNKDNISFVKTKEQELKSISDDDIEELQEEFEDSKEDENDVQP